MLKTIQLADSPWPKSGYDRANTSHIKLPGPIKGELLHDVKLHYTKKKEAKGVKHWRGSCVVTDTMELRVLFDNHLSAIDLNGHTLWTVKLKYDAVEACPVALENGACLITFDAGICIFNHYGECVFEKVLDDYIFDDAGISPNITTKGEVIVGCRCGEVLRIDSSGFMLIGDFGYDIIPPALYSDDSLAISGYYGEGFCRYEPSGRERWKTKFKRADRLVTINQNSVAAVSASGGKSHFYTYSGELLGKYSRASIFAEYSEKAWIARSNKRIAKLNLKGKVIWEYRLKGKSNWGHCQPIVDSEGRIYVLDDYKVLCFSGEGDVIFECKIHGTSWGSLCSIAPGKLAYTGGGRLQIIG